ncbi:MAG: hypothetical protein EBX13_01795 [Proteobacteria bacterium]|nr:hypothetical protein [Pseudomonadota bacterium]
MKNICLYVFTILIIYSCNKESIPFEKMSQNVTNIDFANNLYETDKFNYFTFPYIYFGGGVAAGDFNNDGLEDLFFIGNMVPNKLYLNMGNMKFEDISSSAGIEGDKRWFSGVNVIDINNDGFLDIYCTVAGKDEPRNNVLYVNNQDNTFTEMASKYGIDDTGHSIHSTFFDYDKDGDLDLYVANYPPTSFIASTDYYKYKIENHDHSESDHLYRNDNGRFVDVTKEAGISNFGLTLGIIATDLNNDGYTDVYVSNDFASPDYMYINNGDGTFSNEILNSFKQTSQFGMGIDASDFNNDGWIDIFQLDMNFPDNFNSKTNMLSMNRFDFYRTVDLGLHHQYMQNSLQLNQGNLNGHLPNFSNIAVWAGVSSTNWSWASLFADFDNDGWQDLFVTNGKRRNVNDKDFYAKYRDFFDKMENDPNYKNKEEEVQLLTYLEKMPSKRVSNYIFKNKKEKGFENMSTKWGLDEKTFSNGAIFSDLDNDGDLDLVVNNLLDVAGVYRNNNSNSNFVAFNIKGKSNQLPVGTRVHIKTSDNQYQMRELSLSRGYLSSVSPRLHFGLGNASKIDEVIVEWPDGKQSKLKNVKINSYHTISYNALLKENISRENQVKDKLQFETLTQEDPYVHKENLYDDFKDEILLPHKNSTLGPALAVGDLNGNGLEDYIVGGAFGQPTAMYIQEENGTFKKVEIPAFDKDRHYEDLGIQIFDADNDGDQDVYIASGGNEYKQDSRAYEDRFYENKGSLIFIRNTSSIPDTRISGLEISSNDFDNDGDLDLFIGGRLTPKKYPYPASSRILENQSTDTEIKFVDVTDQKLIKLKNIGLVTTSNWLDFDGDGWDDLIIAGEWMPIRVFKNNSGKSFVEITNQVFEKKQYGWWFDIEKGDFDNDGDIDLIAGNLGLNYKYKASEEKPFRVYLNDFDKNSTFDIVLSYNYDGTEYPVRGRQCSSEQIPAIKDKFKDYNSFASASLEQIYSTKMLDESLKYEITSFSSIYLENIGGKFEVSPLPYRAQFSNINAVVVKDVDDDGNLDAIVAGNLYNSEVETPRNDASYGLWLKGDGKGGFSAQAPRKSGLVLHGDVRNIRPIKVGNNTHLLVAINNQALTEIRIN